MLVSKDHGIPQTSLCVCVCVSVVGGVATQNASEQIEAITSLLGTSDAKWKLVVGHHPVRSYGDHCKGGRSPGAGGDCVDMAFLSPLMNKYQVRLWRSKSAQVRVIVSG